MPDSALNETERGMQLSLRKTYLFNSLLIASAVALTYLSMRSLPARPVLPPATSALTYRPVELTPVQGPLRLVGAWEMQAEDRRFGGFSSLTVDQGRFLAVSDRGAVARFDLPAVPGAQVWMADLRHGPGPWGRNWARDAESLAADSGGRGWWVGYEQSHSLWLYDAQFDRPLAVIDLARRDWWNNRGAEGLLPEGNHLLVAAENGREAMRADEDGIQRVALDAGADVAEASRAPDGRAWLLLRSKTWVGIEQSIAPLIRTGRGYRAGPGMGLPKGPLDNFEGMAIEQRPGGGLRFWLISDDGHRIMARTLLMAMDLLPPEHDKSPATGAGLSKNPRRKQP